MLKIRVLPTLLYRDVELVKGVGFDSWRRVGSVMQAIKVYNMRRVDELVFLDISATRAGHPPDFALIDEIADECFMPLTVGGGVRSVEDVRRLLQVGADKVAINTALVETPEVVQQVAGRFGSQCVIASIDAKRHPDGHYEVFTHSGTRSTGIDPLRLARRAEQSGAGEILLTSIDRDGTLSGYDIELIRQVTDGVSIPVIASGGAGRAEHMAAALREGRAAAVAAASCYHFTELTPLEVKQHLRANGFPVRI
jgi:imidazole glycerol-phosphate synthase subunit HisF